MSRLRILIADDYAPIRAFLRGLVEADHDVVGEVSNGQEAIEAAERLQPDLVLLDISMPVLGGFPAARHLREHLPMVRIIFVSQESGSPYREEVLRLGAHGFVRKGAAASDLLPAIQEAMAGYVAGSPESVSRGTLK